MIEVIHTGPFSVNTLVVGVGKNKVFAVDPACCAFCGDEMVVVDYLKKNNLDCVAIVLTHGHFDHVAGVKVLKKFYPDAPVLIHENDCNFIGSDSEQSHRKILSMMGAESFLPSVTCLPPADSFLEDRKTLLDSVKSASKDKCFSSILTDEELCSSFAEWQVISTPGHTSGSVCLYNPKEKILLSGDTLFFGSFGRTDLGGNEFQLMESLSMLKKIISPDTIVYPGHDFTGFSFSNGFPF